MASCTRARLLRAMTEIRKRPVEEDFDLWKIGRDSAEETHQAEFALK